MLDASTRDLAAGLIDNSGAAPREAMRMLEAFENARAAAKGGTEAPTA